MVDGTRSPGSWWQYAVFYEIAVISFQDSNADGVGDLPGLIARADYLRWLGIDAVWLTPIQPSPMCDFGYDISDYCAVDPRFGTLDDFDRLLEVLHRDQIRVILDFVPNHTSSLHAWFLDSRSSRTSPRRDWYLWADPRPDGGPPNNWLSRFGGSGWEWDQATEQYYYHSFLPEQPDLNWRNPDVRNAMAEVLRFWLRRGVDGFRVDAAAVLEKDPLLRDNPPAQESEGKPPPQRLQPIFNDDRPQAMHYLEEIRRVVDGFEGRVLCGEVQGKTDRIGHFYGEKAPRLHLPLNFVLLDSAWDAFSLQATIDAYLSAVPEGAWPDWVIGGHDKHRIASKIGQDQARILAMLVTTLRGTPFLFAGDEIGMERIPIPPERVRDPFERLVPGYDLGRDGERVPMRWDGSPNAGFTSGDPWLPIGPGVESRNVGRMRDDPQSLLSLYRRLLALRRSEPALQRGAQLPWRSRNDVLAYARVHGNDTVLIGLNTVPEPRLLAWEGEARMMLSTQLDRDNSGVRGPLLLRANEGVVLKLRKGLGT